MSDVFLNVPYFFIYVNGVKLINELLVYPSQQLHDVGTIIPFYRWEPETWGRLNTLPKVTQTV